MSESESIDGLLPESAVPAAADARVTFSGLKRRVKERPADGGLTPAQASGVAQP
ncbi:hypothetical protein ACFVT2_08040 [Streptomyces sp. NPDC058000]|uniref:hypothetical protein n=1 Tax=Streptomyces sp. NPDC058000 TaxID=3346299 RepID=UPI0036E23695